MRDTGNTFAEDPRRLFLRIRVCPMIRAPELPAAPFPAEIERSKRKRDRSGASTIGVAAFDRGSPALGVDDFDASVRHATKVIELHRHQRPREVGGLGEPHGGRVAFEVGDRLGVVPGHARSVGIEHHVSKRDEPLHGRSRIRRVELGEAGLDVHRVRRVVVAHLLDDALPPEHRSRRLIALRHLEEDRVLDEELLRHRGGAGGELLLRRRGPARDGHGDAEIGVLFVHRVASFSIRLGR